MKRDGCYKILKWLFNRDLWESKRKLFNKGVRRRQSLKRIVFRSKQTFFELMFYRAGLDFAAKFIFNQSDASIDDVTTVEEDSKWRPCLL